MHTVDQLRKVFGYDSESGNIIWQHDVGRKIKMGATAGTLGKKGYIQIAYGGCQYLAHRLAWLLKTGNLPKGEVDHKNGVRNDNRWDNLRVVTSSQNKHNIGSHRRTNRSGVLGAAFDAKTGLYLASIRINGKTVNLGRYVEAQEAGDAYLKAKNTLHPTHLRLNSTPERGL